jgi:hypothetical protein
VLETNVSTQEQLQARRREVFNLTNELDRVWTYVAGYPFNATHCMLEFIEGPERWHTNYQDVHRAIERVHSDIVIEGQWTIENRQSIRLPTWPLKQALKIRDQYRNVTDPICALMELHYQSLTSRDPNSNLFFLAKGLELVRSLLPGDKDSTRQKQLPDEVTRELEQSLDWLFCITNNRYEVRHIVRNPKAALLHPKLTAAERRSFLHDADLIIRGVVALQFGIEPMILKSRH